MILPNATLGVLGGGQLGRMFTLAAISMGYRVVVLDETEPSVFDQDNLGGWEHSQSEGVPYWIAAEIGKTISTVRKS